MSTSASEDPDYELNAAWEISPLPFPDRFVPPPRPDPLPSHHTGVAGPSAVQHTQGDDFELNPLWEQHPAKEPIPSHYHPGPPSSHPIVVAGPSGTQQIQKTERPPLIVTGHSNDLLIDTDTSDVDYGTSGTNTQGRFPGSSNFPAQQQHIIPKPTLQERSSDIPMIHEEDEDYNDYNHPSGFRRANEADLSERAGNPPDGTFAFFQLALSSAAHSLMLTRYFYTSIPPSQRVRHSVLWSTKQ
jgi:hypothetical protein